MTSIENDLMPRMRTKYVVQLCVLFLVSALVGVVVGCLLYDHLHPSRRHDYVVTVIPAESGLYART